METYLTDIASLKLKPRSLDDYWSKTRNDIVPGVGKHRLDKLAPEHLEQMYRAMLDAGHAPSHVVKVHRILSRALKIAHRRRIIGENVATLVDPPSVDETEANPFTRKRRKPSWRLRPSGPRSCGGSSVSAWASGRARPWDSGGRTSTLRRAVPPPVAAPAAYVAARLQGRSRLRRTPAPLRALPAGLRDAQGLQARLPEAVPEVLPSSTRAPAPSARAEVWPSPAPRPRRARTPYRSRRRSSPT